MVKTYKKNLDDILRYINEKKEGCSIQELSILCGINRNAVAKYLDVLMACGKVTKKDVGPAKVFIPTNKSGYYELIDLCTVGVLILNTDLTILWANKTFYEIFMVNENEIIGKKIFEANGFGIINTNEFIDDIIKTIKQNSPIVKEIVILNKLSRTIYQIKIDNFYLPFEKQSIIVFFSPMLPFSYIEAGQQPYLMAKFIFTKNENDPKNIKIIFANSKYLKTIYTKQLEEKILVACNVVRQTKSYINLEIEVAPQIYECIIAPLFIKNIEKNEDSYEVSGAYMIGFLKKAKE